MPRHEHVAVAWTIVPGQRFILHSDSFLKVRKLIKKTKNRIKFDLFYLVVSICALDGLEIVPVGWLMTSLRAPDSRQIII